MKADDLIASLGKALDEIDQRAPDAFPDGSRDAERFVRISDDLRLLCSWITDYRDEEISPPTLLIDANCRQLAEQALGHLGRLSRVEDAPRRLNRIKGTLDEMTALINASEQVMADRKAVKYELQNRYLRVLEYVVAADKELTLIASRIRWAIDPAPVEQVLDEIEHALNQRGRTSPVSDKLLDLVDRLDSGLREIARAFANTLQRVEQIHAASPIDPPPAPPPLAPPPIHSYLAGLELLRQEISAERRSTLTSLAGKRAPLRRLFLATASEIRDILFQTGQALETWFRSALKPLETELQHRRERLELQARQLQSIHHSRNRVKREIQALRKRYVATAREIRSRQEIERNIDIIARAWSVRNGPRLLTHQGERRQATVSLEQPKAGTKASDRRAARPDLPGVAHTGTSL